MKNYYHNALVILLTIFSTSALFAQRTKSTITLNDPYCATVEMDKRRNARAGIPNRTADFEQWLRPKVAEYKENLSRSVTEEIYTIPVVVHVIHDGDAEGVDENISVAQIISQIAVLNEDFRNVIGTPGESTNPMGGDVGIEFCLAQRDPKGETTSGIVRHNLEQASWTRAQVESIVKPKTRWDANQYMNIWVLRFGGDDATLGGFAQFPSAASLAGIGPDEGDEITDGVTVNFRTFGSNVGGATYDLMTNFQGGRVATHEIGHWLGLRHIWGDGDCTYDDYCSDTPFANASNTTCDGTEDSCPGGALDMVENYMDYTVDACKNTFTQDQIARMRSVMAHAPRRKQLLQSSACLPAVATIYFEREHFDVAEATDCNSTTIQVNLGISEEPEDDVLVEFFYAGSATKDVDYAVNPSSFVFPAGTKETQSITIEIFNDAVFENNEDIQLDIKLDGTSNAVVTGTAQKTLRLNIEEDEVAIAQTRPVVIVEEDFENGFGSFNTTGNAGSDRFQIASAGLGSGYFYLIQNSNDSQVAYTNDDNCDCDKNNDLLITNTFSLVGYESASLQFEHAFANTFDFAEVLVSTNEGANWTTIETLTNTPVDFGDGIVSIPWKSENIDLTAYLGNASVLIAFRYSDLNDWTYGMAIDNVKVIGQEKTPVQASINEGAPAIFEFGPNAKVNVVDPVSGNVMAILENLSTWDYGCTSLSIDNDVATQGEKVKDLWSDKMEDKIAAKTFHIVPSNNNSSGKYKVTWFYSTSEILDWSSITGNPLSSLEVVKVAETSLNNVNPKNWEAYTVENVTAAVETFGDNYAITATFNTGFSGFAVGNHANAPLAAELTSFQAKAGVLGQADLQWTTDVESQIEQYEVERSFSGLDFESIGTVSARNTGSSTTYNFTDTKPLIGKNYYRLKITGDNGDFTYSQIKLLTFSVDDTEELITFPNPTKGGLDVTWTAPQTENVTLEILSMSNGKLIGQKNWSVEKGSNTNAVSLEHFPSGIYLLKIKGASFQKYTRVIKR